VVQLQATEGFDKLGILVVFNAGVKIKPQHPPAGGFEDFIFTTRQKTAKKTVLQSLPKAECIVVITLKT
jgi:hypothetical protein